MSKPTSFDGILIEAVNDGLKALLGEPAARAVFYHLERSCSLKVGDVPKEPDNFATGLKNLFGEGASLIETHIIKDLYSKLELEYQEVRDYEFTDYLKYAKERAESALN